MSELAAGYNNIDMARCCCILSCISSGITGGIVYAATSQLGSSALRTGVSVGAGAACCILKESWQYTTNSGSCFRGHPNDFSLCMAR
jgi:hypothetical protein